MNNNNIKTILINIQKKLYDATDVEQVICYVDSLIDNIDCFDESSESADNRDWVKEMDDLMSDETSIINQEPSDWHTSAGQNDFFKTSDFENNLNTLDNTDKVARCRYHGTSVSG